MATSAPIALGVGGVAALFLVSGIQGKSLGQILEGDFGNVDPAFGSGDKGLSGPASPSTTDPRRSGETPEKVPAGTTISPFPKATKVVWGRSDQGVDGVVTPGSPLLAMGDGRVEIHHDPSGFGSNYLVLFLDGDGGFYYGHSVPNVPDGAHVKKGQVIAHANTNGQGNATTPGAFEIGKWPPGSMAAGQAIRNWLINQLPRA